MPKSDKNKVEQLVIVLTINIKKKKKKQIQVYRLKIQCLKVTFKIKIIFVWTHCSRLYEFLLSNGIIIKDFNIEKKLNEK